MRPVFLVVAFLLVTVPTAARAADVPSYDVIAPSSTYFGGDWVNISVVGPDPPPVPFLYFNLSDPNGTLVDIRYVQVVNGSANYTLLLDLDATTGNYVLNCTSNGTLIAQVGFTVVYDELNYLSKRVAILERDSEQQAHRLEAQRLALRELDAKVWWYWLNPISTIALWVGFVWIMTQVVIPTWRLQYTWQFPTSDRLSLKSRIAGQIVARWGPSDQRNFYPDVRLFDFPGAADPVIRAGRRAAGLPQEPLPRETHVAARPSAPKVKRIRRRDA